MRELEEKIKKYNEMIKEKRELESDIIELIRLDERNNTLADYDINDYEINRRFNEDYENSFNNIKRRWNLLEDYGFIRFDDIVSDIVDNQTIYYYVFNTLTKRYSRKFVW